MAMDFKSLMSAQIAKTKPSINGKTAETTSKYQRRSEQEAKRQADYQAEVEALQREREQRAEKKRKHEEEEAEQARVREEKKRKLAEESRQRREVEEAEQERLRRKRLGLPEPTTTTDDNSKGSTPLPDDQPDIAEDELRKKLREINQPAIIFEESHASRLRRYYKLTTISNKPKYTKGPIPTTLQPVDEKDMLLPADMTPNQIPPTSSAAYTHLHRQIASYLTLILQEWSTALSQRPPEVQASPDGKRALQIYHTVLSDLTPLYRRLEQHSLPPDLLTPIIQIINQIQQRKYVTANDTYLTLSIGKSAWPIGVTMVGIHERSAREKLHDGDGSNKAHIMADEATRKILQSLKRCLSFAQTRWPPDDVAQLMG